VHTKIQDDTDIKDENNKVISSATSEIGKFLTINIICDICHNEDHPISTMPIKKSDFSFIEPVYQILKSLSANKNKLT